MDIQVRLLLQSLPLQQRLIGLTYPSKQSSDNLETCHKTPNRSRINTYNSLQILDAMVCQFVYRKKLKKMMWIHGMVLE
jgi:hypothetical protein